MKKALSLFIAVTFFIQFVSAQTVTYTPSCYSNADGWQIEKIETNSYETDVYLSFYSYKSDYTFFINPGMYIENYDAYNSYKYYITEFVSNQLNTTYKLEPYTTYYFTLKFQAIPSSWKNINIKEPNNTSGLTPWYWNYITLNSDDKLKLETFLDKYAFDFFKTFVHPTNTYKFCRYSFDYNTVRLTMYYEGYVTDLKIKVDGTWVNNISIVYDNDYVEPFSLLSLIKDYIMSQQDQNKYTNEFERQLGKAVSEMNGRELSCLALTILWNSE